MRINQKMASVAYYGLLVLLPIALLTLLILVVCNWAVHINMTMSANFFDHADISFEDPETLDAQISSATTMLETAILRSSITGLVLVGLLCLLPRARKHDKRTIILSTVTIIFLFVSTALTQSIIRSFVLAL